MNQCPFFITNKKFPSCPRCAYWHTNNCPYYNIKDDDLDKFRKQLLNEFPYLRGGSYEN